LHPERSYLSFLPWTRELQALFSLLKKCLSTLFPHVDLLVPTNYLFSCLPQQGCVGPNPQIVFKSGSLIDGYSTPSPH
jgi:hypothetical protein